jgi:type II secretory pathway pseudopilin PulG
VFGLSSLADYCYATYMSKPAQGLSIIELLLVIGIIGFLAVVLMFVLQPLEQMNKARDQGRLSDARELYSAYDRYYVTYQRFPWDESTVISANRPTDTDAKQPQFSSNTDNSWYLKDMSEVKTNFELRSSFVKQELWVSVSPMNIVSICFEPQSRSARSGGMAPIKTITNALPSPHDCGDPYGASSDCYVCLPF